jgi:hypothetical protein
MGGRLATMWRRLAVAVAIACVVGGWGAPAVGAQQPDPQELWRAFPLDPSPRASGGTTGRPPAAPQELAPTATRSASRSAAPLHEGASSGPSWIVLFAAAAAGAAFVAVVMALQGRYMARRRARRALSVAAEEVPALPKELPWPARPSDAWVPGSAERPPARAQREPERVTYRPGTRATFDLPTRPHPPRAPVAPAPVAPAPAPRAGRAERATPSAAASRGAPVCQVRWSRRSRRFYAVTTDGDGSEKRLARSPQLEWTELSPPTEDSREAQAALRRLAKELREKGWRPLRAKGFDFDERQWYARRFRWPTDAERQQPAAGPPVADGHREPARPHTMQQP